MRLLRRKRRRRTRAVLVARPRAAIKSLSAHRLHADDERLKRQKPVTIKRIKNSIFKDFDKPKPLKVKKKKSTPMRATTQKKFKFENPFERVAMQRLEEIRFEYCKNRKEVRKKIMKLTKGKGMKIKKAEWTLASKEIKCR